MILTFLLACRPTFVFLLALFSCYLPGRIFCSSVTVQKAERLFSETLYAEALPLYTLLLSTSEQEEIKTELALRLAACHLQEGQLQAAFDRLVPLKSSSHAHECLYLLSLVHKKRGESMQALELLSSRSFFSSSFPKPCLIILEKGFHLLQLGHFQEAASLLEAIAWELSDPLPYYFAQLNLIKIHLLTHQWQKATQAFLHLDLLLPDKHPLKNVERYFKGIFFLKTGEPAKAASYFERLLPSPSSPPQLLGSISVLENLIFSRLQHILSLPPLSDEIPALLSHIEQRGKQMLACSSSPSHLLLLADFYLMIGKHLSNQAAYEKGKNLLAQYLEQAPEMKIDILLRQAESAPSYLERCSLYRQLTQETTLPLLFMMQSRLLQGLNEFEEGVHEQKKHPSGRASLFFEQAIEAFHQVDKLGKEQKEKPALFYQATALKYLALSYLYHAGEGQAEQAWKTVISLLQTPSLLSCLKSPQEIYALAGWIALHLSNPALFNQVDDFLQKGIELNPCHAWGRNCLKLQGLICFQLKKWERGEHLFNQLVQVGGVGEADALFWLAYSAEAQNKTNLRNSYLKQVYQKEPQSPYAASAYFHLYAYRDYMRGQRKAIKHLQEMPVLFPSHFLLITAYYLIGMDHKKDHLSEEGRLLRRHDWLAAIDAFQQAESTFDQLLEKQLIPPLDIPYFLQIREQSQLERGKLNFKIAQEASGGKRLIYLDYAETVFKDLIQSFICSYSDRDPSHQEIFSSYPKRWAEAEFQLAKIYLEKGKTGDAEALLNQALAHFKSAQIQKGAGLMRVWIEKAKIAHQKEDHPAALAFFFEAEKGMPCKGMQPEERLSLWIQQSLCYQALHQWDAAMRLLSKVINADVISPLRIQAMFLRAEVYERQGKTELALKQLEAISRQGGIWTQEAQNKRQKLYESFFSSPPSDAF